MKIKVLLAAFCCTISGFAYAQNLVVNPSFETNTGTCSGFTQGEGFSQLVDWNNANSNTAGDSCSSPDLFSPCNTLPLIGGPSPTYAPNSWLGYQCARTGTRYAGFITYEFGTGNYRENLQGRLSQPLQAGQSYCVSMYVSLGEQARFATNNIGVWFSNTQYWRNACPGSSNSLIQQTPQLNYNCAPIMDTSWVRLQWDYVATGGEQYFIIGNFFTNANTQTTGNPVAAPTSPHPFAYYFIDDVSVTPGSCCYAEITPAGGNPSCPTTSNPSSPTFTFCTNDPAMNLAANSGLNCGTTPPTGTWSGPGITNPTTGTFTPSAAGPGTHTINYTLACGYAATATMIVSDCNMQVCREANGSLTVSGGTGPYTWQNETLVQDCSTCFLGCLAPPGCAVNVPTWTNFATGPNIPAPSAYPIRVTDAGGATVTINNAATLPACSADPCAANPPVVSITPTHPTCNGTTTGSAAASVTGGSGTMSYSWNTAPVQTTATATNLGSGTYTVTVTDGNGCTATQSVTLNQPAAITASATSTPAACGASDGSATVSATGGTGTLTYSWNTTPVQTTATATNLPSGNYTVTVTDANNCTATASASVANSGGPTVTISAQTGVTCGGDTDGTATASATGGAGGYTYSWNTTPVQTTATASNLAAGTYIVTVTDASNCTGTANVTITGPTPITINVTGTTQPTCGGTNGSATVNATGGTGTLSYSWNTTPVQTTPTATNLGAGPHTVTVTDASGCTATQNVNLSSPGGPTVVISGQVNLLCHGISSGSASSLASGGTGNISYSWNTTPVQTTASASNLAAGTYTVTVTDGSGCSSSESVTITQPPAITIATSAVDAGCGASDGSATANASGGTGSLSYSWNTTPVQTTPTATNLPAGSYTVTVTDANFCVQTATVNVNNSGGPVLTLQSQVNLDCYGDTNGSATVSATGGAAPLTYTWNTTPVQTGPTALNLSGGTYIATVTDANQCSSSVTVTITQPSAINGAITTTPAGCSTADGTATVVASGGTGPYTYAWSNGMTTSSISGLAAGNYSVIITDATGCTSASLNASVVVLSTANIDAGPDVHIMEGGSTVLTATGGVFFNWSPTTGLSCSTCGTTTATPAQTTTYIVTAIDANGCFGSDTVTVYVNKACGTVFVPTAFSPNDDGQNDLFCVYGDCIVSMSFQLFNRWGEKVFETTDPSICWDGKYKGKPSNPGVFYYHFSAITSDGETVIQKGNVSLVK